MPAAFLLLLFFFDSSSVIRLMVQPVSSDARRTFWPLRSDGDGQIVLVHHHVHAVLFLIDQDAGVTSAGASAPITNCAGSADQSTISTRSPASSPVTACTREPRMPTQVPIGSMRLVVGMHRDLARTPGIARRRFDLEQAFLDFRNFEFEQFHDELRRGARQDQLRDRAPLRSMFAATGRTRSPTRRFSFGIIWSRGSSRLDASRTR